MLGPYFAGSRELVVIAPKKQGKTVLLAALVLAHLLETPDASVYIVASSRDQAGLIFDAMVGFVRRTEALRDQVIIRRGYRELRTDDDGVIKVLAADVDTVDGVRPTLALIDEQARAKTSELYAVLRDGLGPRGGQLVCISTAGDDEASVLGQLRSDAYAMAGRPAQSEAPIRGDTRFRFPRVGAGPDRRPDRRGAAQAREPRAVADAPGATQTGRVAHGAPVGAEAFRRRDLDVW